MKLSRALRVQRGDVVALVGAGGKTSAMFCLGHELATQGWRVVSTTSTHLGADQVAQVPHAVVQSTQEIACLAHQIWPHTLLVGPINPKTNKAPGLPPGLIARIPTLLSADVVINEADGARMLPFKAPADYEPVITPGTTLVVPVVGVDVIGQALDAAHVHRPERVAALTGAEPGQTITPALVATVLTHPQGGLKDVPHQARVVALVNKVQTPQELSVARRLADLLLDAPRIEAVAIGAVQEEAAPVRLVRNRVALVVLAAGESRRFGRLKQLLPWGDGGTLLTHALDVALASRVRPVLVVLGCRAEDCRAVLGDPLTSSGQSSPYRAVAVIVNPDWTEGQSTSVRAGLAALPENVGAVVFHLADLPGVTPGVIEALIARHEATLAPVVWPEYEGQRGNPVLLDRDTFPALQRLTGDVGARPVIMAYARAGDVERVAVEEPGVLLDVDSPQDLVPG
ncbi:MAG: selenium cofactor biosynthesis protein YqeC [Anaerolineae bacterium]